MLFLLFKNVFFMTVELPYNQHNKQYDITHFSSSNWHVLDSYIVCTNLPPHPTTPQHTHKHTHTHTHTYTHTHIHTTAAAATNTYTFSFFL